jgi:hypothetical protein
VRLRRIHHVLAKSMQLFAQVLDFTELNPLHLNNEKDGQEIACVSSGPSR